MKLFILIALFISLLITFAVLIQWAEGVQMRDITEIIVHHSATESGTVESIRKYHIEHNGWGDIGYHKVIYRDGSVHNGRDIAKAGVHAKGRNNGTIGICLIGRDNFTESQRQSLKALCRELCRDYPVTAISIHHVDCPGPGLDVELLEQEILGISE